MKRGIHWSPARSYRAKHKIAGLPFGSGSALSMVYPMTTDECIALSDDELLGETYEALAKVSELDENLAGHLASLVGEWSERFAPEAARAELIRLHQGLDALRLASAALAEDELRRDLEALRRREAARLLRPV